jgi:hypothetical protein
MAHIVSSRVFETSVTSGTGPLSLSGAVNGNFRFGDVMAIGDTCDYFAGAGAQAEEGIATYTGTNTLSRTQVRRSTNGNAAVSWGTETKFVGIVVGGFRQSDVFTRLPRGHINGMAVSSSDAVTTFSIAAGQCAADTAPYTMLSIPLGWSKTLSAWSQGSAGGGLDTGTIAGNTWYYVYAIGKLDGTTDFTFSLSASAPTQGAGWVLKRRIGSLLTNASSQVRGFVQYGDLFLWRTATVDATTVTVGTTQVDLILSVPRLTPIIARFRGGAANSVTASSVLLSSPIETTNAIAVGFQSLVATAAGSVGQFDLLTDSSGRIKAVSNHASTTVTIGTMGWLDRRGQDD